MKHTVNASVLTISTDSACPLRVMLGLLFACHHCRFGNPSAPSF
jgi:hypothetical protein